MLTIIFGRGLQFLLALAIMKMATTLLSPQEMGKVSLTLSTIAFFALFLINPVGMFINRRLHSWYVNGVAKHYLVSYANYLVLVSIAATISLFIMDHFSVINFGMNIGWLAFLVSTSLIFNTINQTSIPSLNLLGNVKAFIVLTIATLLASFVLAIIIVNGYGFTASYWLLGIILGQMIFAVFGTKKLFKQLDQFKTTLKVKVTNSQIRSLSAFCWPVALAAMFWWIQSQSYRYIFEAQLGFAELGLFVAGYSVSAGIIAGFESVLTTYFQPRFYRDVQSGDNGNQVESWLKYSQAVIPPLLITVMTTALLAPELTRFFLGTTFHTAEKYVVWGAISEAARVLISIYSLNAHAQMKTKLLIWPYFSGAILAIALTIFLIPQFGGVGVGIALVASGFLMTMMISFFLSIKITKLINFRAMTYLLITLFIISITALITRNLFSSVNIIEILVMFTFQGLIYTTAIYYLLKNHLPESVN